MNGKCTKVVDTPQDVNLLAFLSKLTELSHETGIGIALPTELFIMEPDDIAFSYVCDSEGKMFLA